MTETLVHGKTEEKIGLAGIMTAIYFAALPFTMVTVVAGFSLLKLVSMITGAALLVLIFVGKNNRFCFNASHLFFTLYVLYTYAGRLLSDDEYVIRIISDLLEAYIMIMIVSMRVYNRKEKALFSYVWIAVGVFLIIMGITSKEVIEADRMTVSILGSREDPNQFCGYFVLPALFGMEKIIKKDKFWYLFAVYELLIMYVVFRTGSRGGLMAMVFPLAFYALVGAKGLQNKLIVILSSCVLVTVVVGVVIPSLPEVTRSRFSVENVVESRGTGRFDLWETIVHAVTTDRGALVRGYGLGSTRDILEAAGQGRFFAHNHWIQMLADQGLTGVFLMLAVFAADFLRNYKHNRHVSASLIGAAALSMSLTLYVFKPFLNILLVSSMSYEGEVRYEN